MFSRSLVVLLVLLLAGSASAQSARTSGKAHPRGANHKARRHETRYRAEPAAVPGPQVLCAGDIPPGWIKTNDRWDPTRCGNPTAISSNVWIVEEYRHKPVGATMIVCAGMVPEGWVVVNRTWNPTTCGRPATIMQNVMMIKRVR